MRMKSIMLAPGSTGGEIAVALTGNFASGKVCDRQGALGIRVVQRAGWPAHQVIYRLIWSGLSRCRSTTLYRIQCKSDTAILSSSKIGPCE